jgi:hypothetical protein
MIRLTRIAGPRATQTIKLEGKLLEPWVDEVRKSCASGALPTGRTSLDLSTLTFVDAAGVGLLRELIDRGIEVVVCSSYVAELLRASRDTA